MRASSFLTARILGFLALPSQLSAQRLLPNYSVRVTVHDSIGERRLIGRITALTPDSLTLQVADATSTLVLDRRTVSRVERRRSLSVGKPAKLGCLVLGGTLALLGSQVEDHPGSHGSHAPLTIAGFVAGCGLGALGGVMISRTRQGWEEIIL